MQNALNAAFSAQVVPGSLYVDGRANITQQPLSAFGDQNVSGSLRPNDNLTEVLNVAISPYVRGSVSDIADYEVRINTAATKGRTSEKANSSTFGSSLSLSSRRSGRILGWSANFSQQRVDFSAGRATNNSRASLAAHISPDRDLVLSLRGGQEVTDVGGFQRRNFDNWGAGIRWNPTERTLVSLDSDHRYFGPSHQLVLEHRWRRVVFRFSSSRDASTSSDSIGVGQPTTLYQLYFAQFAAIEPDPVLRDVLVRDLLRSVGLDPGAIVAGGAVTSAIDLQRRDDVSLLFVGKRLSLTLQAFQSNSRILDNPTGQIDIVPVEQRGYLANLSHRLTQHTSLNFTASGIRTQSTAKLAGNDLRAVSIGLASTINRRASGSLSVRFSDSEGSPEATYRETAYTASLNLLF